VGVLLWLRRRADHFMIDRDREQSAQLCRATGEDMVKIRISRRVVLAVAAAGLWSAPSVAFAQAWPSRPVTVILPFAAGGGTDLLARSLAQHFSDTFGQQFVIDNRAGAGGNVGAAAVAKAAPDGYTILFGTPGPLANNKLMYKNLPFDPEQAFTPIVLVAKSPLIIAAKASLPVKDIQELKAYAKSTPASSMSASRATERWDTSPRCWCRENSGSA
jgi:tripartite-type tricarboxylate transporter receptor subunit TctC